MEYTLEDAFETLKDSQIERLKELEELENAILNNDPVALNRSCDAEDVRNKQHKLCRALLNQVLREEPKDYPIPGTSDLRVDLLRVLEEEVRNARKLLDKVETDLSAIREDISYLENKKTGLRKMEDAYLGAAQMIADTTYSNEYVVTKRLFQQVKKDLHLVVEKLFPENMDFKTFLGDLTAAYTKGGDDTYLDVTPEVLDFTNFLIEADIATYHRNDKSKVRLVDLL